MRTLLIILTFLFCYNNSNAQSVVDSLKTEFHLSEATLLAKDIKLSATWYRRYLNLDIKEYKPQKIVKLKTGAFLLSIKQGRNIIIRSQVRLPNGKKYINGINKIGFACNQFTSLYEALISNDQKIVEEISFDKNIAMRFFVTQDPDGNSIQIFDQPNKVEKLTCSAILFSIISSDYINTMRWYEENIDFTAVEVIDDTKIHFQNLLHKGEVLFEIIHLPYESLETTEFMPLGRELTGFEQLTFKSQLGKNSTFRMDNNANRIIWLR